MIWFGVGLVGVTISLCFGKILLAAIITLIGLLAIYECSEHVQDIEVRAGDKEPYL